MLADPLADHLSFAAIDLETTGFSPRLHDRIIEVAIVRLTQTGSIEDEFVTLVNPLRDVGPTRIHGITATDVAQAPTFTEVLGDVLDRLRGAVLVAHNLPFDQGFLAAEFSMAGVFLPDVPGLCTLRLAYRLNPQLANHRLATCCEAAGFKHDRVHSALTDAQAVARLLVQYMALARQEGMASLGELGCAPDRFPFSLWPSMPASGRVALRSTSPRQTTDLPYLARMVASLNSVSAATERTAPYVDLLDRVLEDRLITETEAETLHATARDWGLSREEVIAAHHSYLESLVSTALEDGRVSEIERSDLEAVSRLLALDDSILRATLDRLARGVHSPDDAGSVLPSDALAAKTVCFTGSLMGQLEGRPITRDLAQQMATAAGLTVSDRVTKDLDILVVSDPNTQSGKARRARKLGTRIMAEAAFWRAIGVQAD